jgi:2-dehydro-3-deoxygalactonokinase
MNAPIIGVDWGTTNLRAFRFSDDGHVLETRRSESGVRSVENGAFEQALLSVIEDWLASDARIFISGMAGSREGWREAPYLPCPASIDALGSALIAPPARFEAWLTPGLSVAHENGMFDVMRGEETQIFGALNDAAPDLIIAPGTHSKWARVEDGCIADIHTHMTGEIFAVLKAHSILGRLMQGDAHDEPAFALGVQRGLADSALLNLLFSVRTEGLFAHVAPQALAAYLSGLLIGSEVAEGLSRRHMERDASILVIGAGEIALRYRSALALAGAERVDVINGEDAAARGLWRIAQAKGAV